MAIDPKEHPDSVDLKCDGFDLSNNQQEFQDRLEFWHFTSLGRLIEKLVGVGSDEKIYFRYHSVGILDIQVEIFSKQLDI